MDTTSKIVRIQSKTVKPTTISLFDDEDLADVYFIIVSEQKKMSAHKVILAGASKVFKAMLYSDFKEKENKIEIFDASAAALKEFLRFIYTNEMDLTADIVAEVMNLAHKYEVDDCFDACKSFLEHHLPDEDVFSGFELAVLFKINNLKATIGKRVGERANIVFKSDEFLDCSRDVLRSILEIKFLSCKPEDVFDGCMESAKVSCEKVELDPSKMQNRRQQLADCLYLIPFRQMKPAVVSNKVKIFKGLFDQEELEELLKIVTTPNSVRLGKFKGTSTLPDGFSKNATRLWCYSEVNEAQVHYIKKSEVTTVHKNVRRLLLTIQLLTIRHNEKIKVDKSLTAILTVKKLLGECQGEILLKQQITIDISPFGSKFTREFPLREYIILEEDKEYEIRIDFDSSWAGKTFFTEFPFPDVNKWDGLVHSLVVNEME